MRRPIVFILVIIALLVPVASASWVAKGDLEPSTKRDARDGFMFTDPPVNATGPTSDAGKVYFNGWLAQSYVLTTSPNPNVGRVGTGVASVDVASRIAPAITRPHALLGVWLDCNRDGYIGFADPGLFEYPVQTPGVDTTLCPAPTVPITKVPKAGVPFTPPHNDGRWIHEFLPIGWNQWATMWDATDAANGKYAVTDIDANPWDLNDTNARVWADFFLPDARNGGGSSCWIIGYPRGSTQSTGGFLELYDCYTQFRVTDGVNSQAAVLDSTAAGQISFKDAPRNQRDSKSILNQKSPLGHEKDAAYVSAWNCNSPQPVSPARDVGGTTGSEDEMYGLNVSAPNTQPSPNTGGSAFGTLNETDEGRDDCKRADRRTNSTAWGNSHGALEADTVNQARAIRPASVMTYTIGFRREGTQTTALGPGTPSDLGVRPTGTEGMWTGDQQVALAASSFVNTVTLQPSRVRHATFYAFVSATAVSAYTLKLPTSLGEYTKENCALPPADQIYNCDATTWYPGNTMPRSRTLGSEPGTAPETCTLQTTGDGNGCRAIGVRPGQPYQLRDIDCWDHTVEPLRREGVHYGVASNTACQ